MPDVDEDEIRDIIQVVLEELKYLTLETKTLGLYLAILGFLVPSTRKELVPELEGLLTIFDSTRAARYIAMERLDLLKGLINVLAYMKSTRTGAAQVASDRRFVGASRLTSEHEDSVYTERTSIQKSRRQPTWSDLLDLSTRRNNFVP